MIERYTASHERDPGSHRNYEIWLEVELLACATFERAGQIRGTKRKRSAKRPRSMWRIAEIEKVTKHDVIARFSNQLMASRRARASIYLHGAHLIGHARCVPGGTDDGGARLISEDLDGLIAVLKKRALEHRHTVMVGRSHEYPWRAGVVRIQVGNLVRRRAGTGHVLGDQESCCRRQTFRRGTYCPSGAGNRKDMSVPKWGWLWTPSRKNQIVPARSACGLYVRLNVAGGHHRKKSPRKSAICNGRKCWRRKNIFRGQKGSSAMPTSAIRLPRKTSAVLARLSPATVWRRWKMSPVA